jgi:hypothetical protein
MDLYEVFAPDLGGAWVEYNGASMAPTYSPAPTWKGGCDDPHNFFLDKCVRKRYKAKPSAVAWDALGSVGQVSVMLVGFMAVTLSVSIFLARARKKRKRGESYLGFFFRDLTQKKKKKRRKKGLEESMLPESSFRRSKSSGRRSIRSSSRTKRRSRSSNRSRGRGDREGNSSQRIPGQPRSQSARPQREDTTQESGSTRQSGVFDLTVANVQPPANHPDGGDNRQQLV